MNKSSENKYDKTSNAVNFFGIPMFLECIEKTLYKFPELKENIISVGSGGGYIEKTICDIFEINVTCVDPDPTSYIPCKTIFLAPKYNNVHELINSEPDMVENCIVFLNWPTPSQEIGYDIDSVLKLKPKCIILAVELGHTRGAGSIYLHEFLSHNNISTQGKYHSIYDTCEKPKPITELFESHSCDIKYNCNAKCDCFYKIRGHDTNFGFLVLSHKEMTIELPTVVTPYQGPENVLENGEEWEIIRRKWDKIMDIYDF
jgi:hypothetical protein